MHRIPLPHKLPLTSRKLRRFPLAIACVPRNLVKSARLDPKRRYCDWVRSGVLVRG
jgi:hypothetical protein